MNQETPCDALLIKKHLQGSSTAIAQLWLKYDRLVYGIAHSVVCSREAAEDIRQEVFLKAYTELPQLQELTKFASWLRSITYNACYSYLRRQRKTTSLDALTDVEQPKTASVEANVEGRELRTLLRKMIDRLPEEYRTVIELHYFEGQRVADIAEFLELSGSTIKWRIHKAREVLQRTAKINGYLE
ncbi:MAG: RNA polymerase sigma factor [Candidatus Poribacteria bacterium]|nr:RNA polymerase sigma factor [Candidatus Poribacteria bacterium]